ncbi:carbohydrate kinase family protein [Sinomicrobium weinanense]|uniref:Carbohydrate kinase n=1 Tax=Sinomicrobium weinanense TaxID=2842200 RepID=A0A926Q4H7_9FLAO|nr:carbohydrate kinase [Sinomicrobium weinanense]MBC9797096.1 carbohydrate kinase [Sinomicrobium weinanense]MBU3124792.1 carbohydrate kinase [Sinomicrobium weinanense]
MDKEKKLRVISFGEVLWDCFPDRKNIGGAPLNVALRMRSLGCDVNMISCIGNDEDGRKIRSFLEKHGVGTVGIAENTLHPTGAVKVSLNDRGSATYEITYPSAWDKIPATETTARLASDSDLLVYGSLACRDELSENTLHTLLSHDIHKVFDVNLRSPHYTVNTIGKLMDRADFIKFNDDELYEIAEAIGSPYRSLEQNITYIAEKTVTPAICVTKGRHGAVLWQNGKWYYNSGYNITVKDTVGAGDSFLATLLTYLFHYKSHPQDAINHACAMGALVAESKGANPLIDDLKLKTLMQGENKIKSV